VVSRFRSEPIELLLDASAERPVLRSPRPGFFTLASPEGALLGPGQAAGVLLVLGEARPLVVPAGVAGRVASARPDRVRAPVAYGDPLYELAPLEGLATAGGEEAAEDASGAPALRAGMSGRFWHCAAPGRPPFVAAGDVIEEGRAVGVIEVMKTFNEVLYRPADGLPPRARVVRLVPADGAEVAEGDALVEVEPA
jgi:hypothetical protein